MSPDRVLVEMIEIKDHPWFVATQAHPEFKSRPNKPHPLFQSFVKSCFEHKRIADKKIEILDLDFFYGMRHKIRQQKNCG
jgi:CTP synthase (UTP-ammonia lyase)